MHCVPGKEIWIRLRGMHLPCAVATRPRARPARARRWTVASAVATRDPARRDEVPGNPASADAIAFEAVGS